MTTTKRESLRAFINLLARYREGNVEIYDLMAPGYDRFAADWEQAFAGEALEHLIDTVVRRLPPNARVLDAGCGTGRRTSELLSRADVSEIVAIDASANMLEMARRKIRDRRVRFVQGDIRNLPFDDCSFDAVVSTWVLETFRDPRRVVNEFLRVINDDGFAAYTFLAIPRGTVDEITDHLLAEPGIAREHFRRFVRPYHVCERSSLKQFHDGLLTVATVSRCCEIDDPSRPCKARHESV